MFLLKIQPSCSSKCFRLTLDLFFLNFSSRSTFLLLSKPYFYDNTEQIKSTTVLHLRHQRKLNLLSTYWTLIYCCPLDSTLEQHKSCSVLHTINIIPAFNTCSYRKKNILITIRPLKEALKSVKSNRQIPRVKSEKMVFALNHLSQEVQSVMSEAALLHWIFEVFQTLCKAH